MDKKEQIITLLSNKSVMKQDVYKKTFETFKLLGKTIKDVASDLQEKLSSVDKRISVAVTFKSDFEIELKVAGDILVFHMHTNVFDFDRSHPMFKTSYIKQNEYNSYCGIIYAYNFLSDSFKYNRLGDSGYLIGRLFVNREQRFFMEAKPPIGYRYNTFSADAIDPETLKEIVYDLVIYVVTFDLFTPPFEIVKEISVNEIVDRINSNNLKTGKRLGYRLSAEKEDEDINL
ncbi:MAG: hypothetical protein ACK5D5_06120 [Bacteroidota bacterium]|jgi:hypothetical protein